MASDIDLTTVTGGLVDQGICSLSPDQLEERLAMIRSEIEPSLIARADLPDGVVWEFESNAETRARLERLAELERECCGGGLEFRVREDDGAGRLRFEIRGAEAGAFRALSSSRSAVPAASARTPYALKRFAKAGGVGAAASLLVCCVLPIGVAAVVGASVAGPLLKLDQPWIIAASAVVFGSAMWVFERRREAAAAAQKAAATDCGC